MYLLWNPNKKEIHKKAKSYYLNWGRAVDAFKNVVTFAIEGKETELEKLEKHFENIEKERIEKLQSERLTALLQAGHINFEHLQHLVLDEADKMLDMGFLDDIKNSG